MTVPASVTGGEPKVVKIMSCGLIQDFIGYAHGLPDEYCQKYCMVGRTEFPNELTAGLTSVAKRSLMLRVIDKREDDDKSNPWHRQSIHHCTRESAIEKLRQCGDDDASIRELLKRARSNGLSVEAIMKTAKSTRLVDEGK